MYNEKRCVGGVVRMAHRSYVILAPYYLCWPNMTDDM